MADEDATSCEGAPAEIHDRALRRTAFPTRTDRSARKSEPTPSSKSADADRNRREIKQEIRPCNERDKRLCLTRIQKISGDGSKNIVNYEMRNAGRGD